MWEGQYGLGRNKSISLSGIGKLHFKADFKFGL